MTHIYISMWHAITWMSFPCDMLSHGCHVICLFVSHDTVFITACKRFTPWERLTSFFQMSWWLNIADRLILSHHVICYESRDHITWWHLNHVITCSSYATHPNEVPYNIMYILFVDKCYHGTSAHIPWTFYDRCSLFRLYSTALCIRPWWNLLTWSRDKPRGSTAGCRFLRTRCLLFGWFSLKIGYFSVSLGKSCRRWEPHMSRG